MKGRTWDTEKARALYSQGLTDGVIAAEVRATKDAVGFWRREQGLPANRKPPSTERDAVELAPAPDMPGSGVALSIETESCLISIRAPSLEAARAIYSFAGGLLKDMASAAEQREAAERVEGRNEDK